MCGWERAILSVGGMVCGEGVGLSSIMRVVYRGYETYSVPAADPNGWSGRILNG